jgi:hypothetical protein
MNASTWNISNYMRVYPAPKWGPAPLMYRTLPNKRCQSHEWCSCFGRLRAWGLAWAWKGGARDAGPALDTKSLINRGANSHIAKHLGCCRLGAWAGRAGRAPGLGACMRLCAVAAAMPGRVCCSKQNSTRQEWERKKMRATKCASLVSVLSPSAPFCFATSRLRTVLLRQVGHPASPPLHRTNIHGYPMTRSLRPGCGPIRSALRDSESVGMHLTLVMYVFTANHRMQNCGLYVFQFAACYDAFTRGLGDGS